MKKCPKTSFHAVITSRNPTIRFCSNPKIFTKSPHGTCASDGARKPSLPRSAIDNFLLSPEGLSFRLFFAFESPMISLRASVHFKPKPEMNFRLMRKRRSFRIHFFQELTLREQNRLPESDEFFFSPQWVKTPGETNSVWYYYPISCLFSSASFSDESELVEVENLARGPGIVSWQATTAPGNSTLPPSPLETSTHSPTRLFSD